MAFVYPQLAITHIGKPGYAIVAGDARWRVGLVVNFKKNGEGVSNVARRGRVIEMRLTIRETRRDRAVLMLRVQPVRPEGHTGAFSTSPVWVAAINCKPEGEPVP